MFTAACGLTGRSSGPQPAGRATLSSSSSLRAASRFRPLSSDVRHPHMILRSFSAALGLSAMLETSLASTPPPPMSVEEQICTATHVFIGTAKDVRFVNASSVAMCRGEPAFSGGALTSCGQVEVDVTVSEVLFPPNWEPKETVIYRFGGGLFSTESLKADLEGQAYLFHVKSVTPDGNSFVTSTPWVLGKSPREKANVDSILSQCRRR